MRSVANVLHVAAWGKWPETDDMNYSAILGSPSVWGNVIGYTVPAYLPRIRAGRIRERPRFYDIDNTKAAPPGVAEQMLALLRDMAKTCTVLLWNSAIECFPEVAKELPGIFPVRILHHADDCPFVTPTRTLPVARYFTHLLHWMGVYDFSTGQRVRDLYAAHGLATCYHGGFVRYPVEVPVLSKETDLCFLGTLGHPVERTAWMRRFGEVAPKAPAVRLHGHGARDGHWPGAPAEVYARSRAGLNFPVSSLFNTRLFDLWMTGITQAAYDRHGELEDVGFVPDKHYIKATGSQEDVLRQVREAPALDLAEAKRAAEAFLAMRAFPNVIPRLLEGL